MKRRGFGIMEVLIAVALLGVVTQSVMVLLRMSTNSSRTLANVIEKDLLKMEIMSQIDCEATFATGAAPTVVNPTAPGINCNSTSVNFASQVAPYFRLRRRTLNGSVQWLGGPLDANGVSRLGDWFIRTSCSTAEQTLVIRALPAIFPAGTNVAVAGNGESSRLVIGGAANVFPICFDSFTGTVVWQNTTNILDVNDDGYVTPVDVLNIINEVNRTSNNRQLISGVDKPPPPFYDVDGDGLLEQADANTIISNLDTTSSRANPWTNPTLAVDINGNGTVEASDINVIVTRLNDPTKGKTLLLGTDPVMPAANSAYWDVNADGRVDSSDKEDAFTFLNLCYDCYMCLPPNCALPNCPLCPKNCPSSPPCSY